MSGGLTTKMSFLKAATILVELLIIELWLHLAQELILCMLITRGGVDFNGDSAVKSPCRRRVLNLSPSDPGLF